VTPNGERTSKHAGLMVKLGLGWLTTAQCARQFQRAYWEWLRQDTALVGDDGGGDGEGAENFYQEHGEGDGYDDDGADEDFMDEQ